jgi:hypothetical protein
MSRAGGEVVLEAFDAFGASFGEDFDAAVIEVANVADDLMTRGDPLREETKPDALNLTADDVVPRDLHVKTPLTVGA